MAHNLPRLFWISLSLALSLNWLIGCDVAVSPTDREELLQPGIEEESGAGKSDAADGEGAANEGAGEASEAETDLAYQEALEEGLNTNGFAGNVRVYLTDAPAEFDAVWVTISSIQIHRNGDEEATWITLQEEAQSFDLLTLQEAVTAVLGDADVTPGSYSQLRLMVVDAWLVVNGGEEDLTIPSGDQTGLKINLNFTVEQGVAYVLVLDFDAGKSVKKTGQGYLMTPVIKVKYIGYLDENGEVVEVDQAGETIEGEDPPDTDSTKPNGQSGDKAPLDTDTATDERPEGSGDTDKAPGSTDDDQQDKATDGNQDKNSTDTDPPHGSKA